MAAPRWIPTAGTGSDAWVHSPVERLFPGGLAVSRTIGDTSCSQAAVPVPDVYRLPLDREHVAPNQASVSATALCTTSLNRRAVWSSKKFNADSRRSVATASTVESAGSAGTNPATAGPEKAATPRTFRFVLATDGLWDMLSSEQVGLLAARTTASSGAEEIPAHVSATRIMQECLARCQEGKQYDDITILVLDVAIL